MKNLKILCLPFFLLLAACTSISEVVPVGKDTFMLTGSNNHSRSTGGEIKVELFKVANAYCASLGKELMPVKTSSVDARLFNSSTSDLYFRCLLAGDPELRRPDFNSVRESLGKK